MIFGESGANTFVHAYRTPSPTSHALTAISTNAPCPAPPPVTHPLNTTRSHHNVDKLRCFRPRERLFFCKHKSPVLSPPADYSFRGRYRSQFFPERPGPAFTKIDFRSQGAKINFADRTGPARLVPKLVFAPGARKSILRSGPARPGFYQNLISKKRRPQAPFF